MAIKINGIQQIGVGVENVAEAFVWYRKHFGMDIKMFEESAVAELMLPHTAGKTCARHAILALSMRGGGGFEIWQHTGKTPEKAAMPVQLGDLGINITKLKANDVHRAYKRFVEEKLDVLGPVVKDPRGREHFFLKDIYGNLWQIVEEAVVFQNEKKSVNGGVFGVVIGVKDVDESLKVYRDILGYTKTVYDKTGLADDLMSLPAGNSQMRRVLLAHTDVRQGAFSPFFGPTEIELVQVLDREPADIYKGRIWGDPGFIHLCFDVNGMAELREHVKKHGFPFTVDSSSSLETFDMGEAAGNFAYIQAPEGTLVEFVETHKIPLIKKIGWYLDLRKRGNHPLPNWMLGLFRFMRVKD